MSDVIIIDERPMTNIEPQPPPRPMPVSTIQLAHATSDAVVSGLAKSPYLLGVVVLVTIGVGAAVYFLNILIQGQAVHLNHLLELQRQQQTEIITLHQKEFDALLEMANRLSPVQTASVFNQQPPVTSVPPPVGPQQPQRGR